MNFISKEFDVDNLVLTIGITNYIVEPSDATFVCLWLPTTNVKIQKNSNDNIYNILITNKTTNEVASAFRL